MQRKGLFFSFAKELFVVEQSLGKEKKLGFVGETKLFSFRCRC